MALAFRVIKDVPTQKQIAGRTRTSETGGVRIQKFFNRKKAWDRNFPDS